MSAVKSTRSRRSPKAKLSGLTDRLAEAAWAEADIALAEALRAFDEAKAATTPAKRAIAMDTLELALSLAGRRRGLSRIGALGGEQAFDVALHEVAGSPPARVQIVARGAKRGDEVLVRALAKKPK
jgi:hypothetical protein